MGLCMVHPQYKNGPFIPAASLFFYLKGIKYFHIVPYGTIFAVAYFYVAGQCDTNCANIHQLVSH